MTHTLTRWAVVGFAFVLGNVAMVASGQQATTSSAPATTAPAGDAGLLPLIPAKAILFVEHRGHDGVREAFNASNLGQMWKDEAIKQFVNDSRVQIGKLIVKGLFDREDETDITKDQQTLHELLKPFWYHPAAMFMILDSKTGSSSPMPSMGFFCLTGDQMNSSKAALETLMKIGVPAEGTEGTRQAFTHKSGGITWQGVAKMGEDFALPTDPAERIEKLNQASLFMVYWRGDLLCVATSLQTADAISEMLAGKAESIVSSPGLKAVQAKTAMKDWAFRWYFNTENTMKRLVQASGEPMPAPFKALGLDKIRGIGGTEGYADNVYTRLTYMDSGPVTLFNARGSYKQALSMVPSESAIVLAGSLDTQATVKLIRTIVTQDEENTATTASAPATQSAGAMDEDTANVVRVIEMLAEASTGNGVVYVTDLQSLATAGMMGGAGMPVGFVIGIKDAAKADKAIEELAKLIGQSENADEETDAKALKTYRNFPIRRAGNMVRIATMKDRVVIALGDGALKAAIDAAADNAGGFAPNSEAAKLTGLAGEGSAVFSLDLAAIAQVVWPFLAQLGEGDQESFPLASLPSAEKMARLLGPEVAVLQPDATGLLLKSRGKIPFTSKMVPIYGGIGGFFAYAFMSPTHREVVTSRPAATTGPATTEPTDEQW